jgi:hypothetical protein
VVELKDSESGSLTKYENNIGGLQRDFVTANYQCIQNVNGNKNT